MVGFGLLLGLAALLGWLLVRGARPTRRGC